MSRQQPTTLSHRLPLLIAGVGGLLGLTLLAEGVIVMTQSPPTPDGLSPHAMACPPEPARNGR